MAGEGCEALEPPHRCGGLCGIDHGHDPTVWHGCRSGDDRTIQAGRQSWSLRSGGGRATEAPTARCLADCYATATAICRTNGHTDTDPISYTDIHTAPCGSFTWPRHSYADIHTHIDTHTSGGTFYAPSNRHANSYPDHDADAYQHVGAHSYANQYPRSNRYPDHDPGSNQDANHHAHPDGDTDEYCGSNRHPDRHARAHHYPN
jgi:hypothetical protein